MPYTYEDITIKEAVDLLRKWRENNERNSQEVSKLWTTAIIDVNKLGNEKHLILEQVFYASLDVKDYVTAQLCLIDLSKEFPGSLRVMRYHAALREAEEEYDEALEILDHIIMIDETNSVARKRRVAILKAQGNIPEAIKELVDYLKKFMSDVEAWQELCSLYGRSGEYSRAAFCAEELLLHQPHSHLAHQRLADIRYTMGGVENMELAKSYYCQALKLNPNNLRAKLGLFLATNNLLGHYKSSGNGGKRKEAWRLCQWARSSAVTEDTGSIADAMLTLAIAE